METLRRKRNDKKKLKEQIVETAMEAFTKLGIRCVRMDDIALSLSISKRTLYELFRDKENLLLEGLRMQQQQVNEAMIEVTTRTENVLEVIFAFYKRKLSELCNLNPQFFRDLRIIRKTKCSGISEQNVPFLKRNVPLNSFFY